MVAEEDTHVLFYAWRGSFYRPTGSELAEIKMPVRRA